MAYYWVVAEIFTTGQNYKIFEYKLATLETIKNFIALFLHGKKICKQKRKVWFKALNWVFESYDKTTMHTKGLFTN